ncbi:MAG TPA: pantoate--beta-alanine ligase [Rhodanobacteraceae bacterium]|nr:pantoate--beta-alanine ligase [Rhodanobacteraceae bacterium]
MRTATDAPSLRAAVRAWKQEGLRVGFVPTLGNLHAGHYSLLELARKHADRVVVSVFVNPTQFAAGEDFEKYPRTLMQDSAGLAEHECDLLFAPEVETIYPYGPQNSIRIHVPQITEALEGAHRPGHFDGVATVVAKLFALVAPDLAVFGQKDWQQLLVVKRLVRELAMPIEIIAAPTLRADDGLALSSRNQYLSKSERALAPQIHGTLQWMRKAVLEGEPRAAVEGEAVQRLQRAGFVPDYAVVRRAEDLSLPENGERDGLIALIAARLGSTRLIDNLAFDSCDRP